MAANFEEVGTEFVKYYYGVFDSNRADLAPLYRDNSMLTFEGDKFQGSQNITQKLVGLQFQAIQHQVVTLDAQPCGDGGVLVFVSGNLSVGENPIKFAQTFMLLPSGDGNFYVANDMFRLNYC